MKIALINDSHWGIKNDSLIFIEYYDEFYSNIFLPYLTKNNISNVCILGDVFDKRKQTNHITLSKAKEILFTPLSKNKINTIILAGNHDLPTKNSTKNSSIKLLLAHYDNIDIVDVPTEYTMDGTKILMLPWICENNEILTFQKINKTEAKYCFAHLELSGFCMNAGYEMKHGMDASLFKKFKRVFTGHYHHKSSKGNISYLGTQYELTWMDFGDIKGFHILDTDTGELEFIENPIKMHHKIIYTGKKTIIPDNINNKILKVIVQEKDSQKNFDNFIERLYEESPYELKIQESILEYNSDSVDDVDLEIESTSSIIAKYIDNSDVMVDKEKLKELLQTIYSEAEISA